MKKIKMNGRTFNQNKQVIKQLEIKEKELVELINTLDKENMKIEEKVKETVHDLNSIVGFCYQNNNESFKFLGFTVKEDEIIIHIKKIYGLKLFIKKENIHLAKDLDIRRNFMDFLEDCWSMDSDKFDALLNEKKTLIREEKRSRGKINLNW